jgi:predicted HicB family RNase H-like nuclease
MRSNPQNVTYNDLFKVCEHYYFGKPRQRGTSHAVFKMPWAGDPRVNIQKRQGQGKDIPGAAGPCCDRQEGGDVMDTLELPSVDASHYTYRVTWSAEDGEFVATCLEFPSLSWLAESRNAAIDGLEHLVAQVVADMGKTGEQIPEPFAERRFSGTFNVRIGEHLHRDLAMHAAEERMSLNQYIVRKLAAG